MEELPKRLCIPTVDCSAIDTIKTPTNCTTCLTCKDNWGSCDPQGLVCKRGSLDLDPDAPGCESQTSDAHGQWVLHSTGDAPSFFTFNGERVAVPMKVSALAVDEDDSSCVPSLTVSCAYGLRSMQLEISDFMIPEGSWNGGVATVAGPVGTFDDGTGLNVVTPMLFAFDVREDSKRRVALSPAAGEIGVILNDAHSGSLLLNVSSIDFGGYKLTDLFLNSNLSDE